MNKTEYVMELLKSDWYSAYRLQRAIKSSSADRLMRFIRNNPPKGLKVYKRKIEATKNTPWHYEYCLSKK